MREIVYGKFPFLFYKYQRGYSFFGRLNYGYRIVCETCGWEQRTNEPKRESRSWAAEHVRSDH